MNGLKSSAMVPWRSLSSLARKCVHAGSLVADLPVGLPCDEAEIRDVVHLAVREAPLEYGFREDVMELELVLGT